MANPPKLISKRFRGFLPIVIDVETGGVNPNSDALLELAAISIKMDPDGLIYPDKTYHYHTLPFEGANLNPESLAFNKIDPFYPLRFAVDENEAICQFFKEIQKECKTKQCQRAVVVGHNAWFDQQFLNAAAARCNIKHPPFHHFTSFDTATLSALAFGQTVLPKALALAKIEYNPLDAHSALYDAECTAKLFCHIINKWPLSV